jgi:hypothetical protein
MTASTPDFSWRPGLARDIAAHYTSRPGLAFALLGGSTARGETDAWSDLDILIYWEKVDAAWLETPRLAGEGVRRFFWRETFPGGVWLEQYEIGAQKIDVAHIALPWWEEVTGDVVERGDAEEWKLGTIGGFMEAQPLHGAATYAEWRSRLQPVPEALITKRIAEHLFFYPPWVIENQGLRRGDDYAFYDILRETVRNLVTVLAGLNRLYFSADKMKRVGATVERMPIRPRDARTRFDALYTMERASVPAALPALVGETLDLVETHRPDIDTARVRKVFAMVLGGCTERPRFPGPA